MVSVRIERKANFNILGVKTWIAGTDNAAFGAFWEACRANGTIDSLRQFHKPGGETSSAVLGLSCTEKDPSVRSFYFYIAVETTETAGQGALEVYPVGSYEWAIFSAAGSDVAALMQCEMHAWMEWLPDNGVYEHDNGPELEVYFAENKIEYWLPVRRK